MSIQTDTLTAMKLFVARLDDANADFVRDEDAIRYLSRQTVLLTDLLAVVSEGLAEVANRLDALERQPH
ncbi:MULTISPECIES: hypothetical protein [unclassified Microbacterium]|uniref:hypothetical protein n=1 Tax=unclassified Microbacterium TaxID=2609290 RepID=UPI00300FEAB6